MDAEAREEDCVVDRRVIHALIGRFVGRSVKEAPAYPFKLVTEVRKVHKI